MTARHMACYLGGGGILFELHAEEEEKFETLNVVAMFTGCGSLRI
jgi:hypothetical protein